jgi:hypothetical protein
VVSMNCALTARFRVSRHSETTPEHDGLEARLTQETARAREQLRQRDGSRQRQHSRSPGRRDRAAPRPASTNARSPKGARP